jgi:hypothetical protein
VVLAFHIDLWQQAIKPGRHPPVTGPQQFHGGWHEDHSNDGGVKENGHSHAETEKLQLAVVAKNKGAKNTDHDEGGSGDDTGSSRYSVSNS